MDIVALLTLYYAGVAGLFNWFLPRNSASFNAFLAIVLSQTILFGGQYLYDGHWNPWNDIALITSSALCVLTVSIVTIAFRKHRAESTNAPTWLP